MKLYTNIMKYQMWPKGKPYPFDSQKLKRLLQTPKIAKEKKQVIKTSSIDHVHFYVSDLKRTMNFYKELFGFQVYEGSLEEGFVIIGNKDIKLCLMENAEIEHFHSGGF